VNSCRLLNRSRPGAFIGAIVAAVCCVGVGPAIAQTTLVAAYGFNEGSGTTTADLSGNGNTGTVSNTVWTTGAKYGGGLIFNGTNALVTIADAASLHLTTGMTLEAWVYPTTVDAQWRDVIYKGNDNYWLEGTSSHGAVPAIGATFGTNDTGTFAPTALPVNTWTHLAATYDGATVTLYVNGTAVASAARTGNLATSINPLQIGGDSLGGQFFAGEIDEVRVYNGAVTAAQIQADMNTPLGGGSPTPDMTVTKSHSGSFAQGQTGATYTLSVGNVGTAASSGTVTVTDTLPASGLTATALSGTGWSCTLSTLTCTRSDALAAGANYPALTLTVNVASNAPPSVTNTAVVSGGGETNTGNDTASDPTTIVGSSGTQLAAAYSFNEGSGTTVTDLSGNGNTGTIANATWTTAGKYGNALSFNGTNSMVTIPDSVVLHLTTGMTLEAWVQPTLVNALWRDVIYKAADNYYLEGTSSHGGGLPDAGVTLVSAPENSFGTSPLATGTWTHLASTYDGATLSFYVNGVLVSSVPQTGSIITSTNPLQIGGDSLNGQFFQGLIDEVRVYYVALTATQIQADMNTPLGSGGNPTPDMTVTKSHSGSFTQGQTGATYTLTVSNVGTAASFGTVMVTDTLPASGLTATALSGTGWNCTLSTLTCTRSDALAVGASYPAVTLTVNVASNAPASVTNTAAERPTRPTTRPVTPRLSPGRAARPPWWRRTDSTRGRGRR